MGSQFRANKGSTTLRNAPDVAAEGNTDNYICYDGKYAVDGAEPVSQHRAGLAIWRWRISNPSLTVMPPSAF